MEPEIGYDRFNSSDAESRHQSLFTQMRWNKTTFIMFGVLSLVLFTLTLTVGIKFSQVNKQMADLTLSVQTARSSEKAHQTGRLDFLRVPAPERGACEEDWSFYNGRCYFLSKVRKNWHNAKTACSVQNAQLLVVNDANELDYVSELVAVNQHYWIGLVEEEEGEWSWVDGTDFNSTEHFWDEGQPDDWDLRINGEDCGQLHAATDLDHSRSLWNDADCTIPYRYVCEKTLMH